MMQMKRDCKRSECGLIVLESDPFTCPPQDLHSLSPSATMIDGEWVYQA